MSDSIDSKEVLQETDAQIKVLFSKLTELIMGKCKNRRDVANMIVLVGNWVGILLATLAVTSEGSDQKRVFLLVDRMSQAINSEMKKNTVILKDMIKGIGQEEKKA